MKILKMKNYTQKMKKWSCTKGIFLVASFLLLVAGTSCEAQQTGRQDVNMAIANPEKFADYWYAGEAELNRYELSQMRYGEERKGELILVYVTEDFLPERQVKDESQTEGSVKVLKLNYMKNFITGIYDYSLMTSTFTPIDFRKHPYTLKSSFSSQDWCGQSFSQINLRERTIHYQLRSYFEKEGDMNTELAATYFEEDIWTRMRLEPQMLPLGDVELIPSQEFIRLHHKEFKPYKAKAVLLLQVGDQNAKEELYVYTVEYPDLGRTVKWTCQSKFPFQILEWEERIAGNGKDRVSRAVLSHSLKNSYWALNGNEHEALRDSLGVQLNVGP
jgi:hypothetical protein